MYANSGGGVARVTSPDSALASDVFDKFCNAVTFKSILSLYRQLCDLLRLKPTYFPLFYPKLKAKLRSWKAQALWSKFDKRAAHRCYNRGRPCSNTRVLIIGGGPCGLRTAIEAQLLGAKVVVVEKRDRFSRNNVLHLWPFVIHDLRALGAKKFFGKFCAGSIDHISIRQLQCILLKVALLLGVEIHENVTFDGLVEPPEDQSIKIGWKAKVSPLDHPVSQYEFDVLIGADGKRNTLDGFKRKEFRGRLAIAITANLVNKKSEAEARVEEISGVAFIFNQKFFKELNAVTGIDLENIVYYKDETHYFVMTAKKQSLLNKGVIIQDYPDTVKLLSIENVNKEALMDYARQAADFSTNYQLPHLDFAVNHYGQPDVAMFDFTSMFAAENASRVLERHGHKMLMCLVGDSLLEPFWPTGSGCARGWLSSFDACWAIHSWSSGRMTPLEVLAERESIYRLLAQTTPENLNKDYSAYTVEPQTRYPNLNTRACLEFQVKSLYDTDNTAELERPVKAPVEEGTRKRSKRPDSFIHPDTLLLWLKKQIALYDITITDVTTSFQDGLALCAIIHRYRPDLLDFASLDPANVAVNNQLAFDILEELGLPPVTTGYEMAQLAVPDKLAMLSYLTQVHELFRGEIPCVKQPKRELTESEEDILGATSQKRPVTISSAGQYQRAAAQNKTSSRLSTTNKRKTLERVVAAEASSTLNRTGGDRNKADMSLRKARKRRSTDRSLHGTIDRSGKPGARGGGASEGSESLSNKVRDLEAKLRGNRPTDKKPKDLIRAIGKLDKNDWQLSALEKKIEENQTPGGLKDPHDNKVPKWNRDAFTDKFEAINRRIHGLPVEAINEKHSNLERNMKQLERKLKEGSVLDTGHRGSNKVSAMAQQLSKKVPEVSQASMNDQAESFRPKPVLNLPQQGGSETCHFCAKRVYLMERMNAEGRFFHRGCFRCEYCATTLRLGGYAFVRDDLLGGVFFCMPHVSMLYYMRNKLIIGRHGENCVDGQIERRIAQPVAAQPTSQHLIADKPVVFEPLKSPLVQAAVQAADPDFRRDGTPERVEFENSIADEAAKEDQLSEIDEDEWTDHNFGNSTHSGTEDEASSLDDSSSDEEEDGEGGENVMELDPPLTAEGTRRLAEAWKKRHLAEAADRTQHEYRESPHESIPENEEENNVRIDVPAFPLPSNPCYKKSSEEATSSGTEMGSEDEPELEDEEDEEEYVEESEYESGEEEEDEDDEDEEDEETEDEEDARDSATEIETDSEFDQNSNADVRLGPQGIPTIVVNESEAEQLKKSTDQLANGNGLDGHHVSDGEAELLIPTQSNGNPKPNYVEQYISLENARPLQRTLSHDDSRKMADPPTTPGRLLAYLRRHEELERSPSATDMMASKNSLELKKKYLDYGGSTGSLVQKSASAADLDSRLRSVTDTISEAQKKLNPAPQPSVPMQVFLQNTANIFHPRPQQLPSVLPVKNDEPTQPAIEKEISAKELDDSEEPATPTNCEPAAEAVDPTEVVPVISSDSGSSQTNENIADEATSSDSEEPKADSDASSGFDTDSEPDTSEAPYEALNHYVALPSVVVEEDEEPAVLVLQNEPAVPLSQSDDESPVQPPHPQLAMQENFDLSPSSEKVDLPEKLAAVLTRTRSRESVDSSKFALSETEFSDWADTSLRGDLDVELNVNPGAKQMATKEPPMSSTETPSAKPTLDKGTSNFDDIEYADNSEEQAVDLNGYTPLVEELPTPDKPDTPVAVPSPEVPNFAFSRLRDSIAMSRDRQSPLFTPIKDERVHKEIHRRMLEKKKYESSPNLLRKKEAISQERERQGDLVREMVFSRIQRTSPEKTRERRGSYGSMTPPGSSRASRSDSEPRSTISPDRRDIFATPHSSLRSVAEIPPPLSNEYMTPISSSKKDAEMNNEGSLGAVKRELFISTPSIRPTDNEFKTPNLKEWQDVNRQLERQDSARKEARAKAQAKADQDLGLSPPDYIENLKDKLRRKPSVDDDSNEVLPVRTRSFSEPNVDAEKSWDLPSRPNVPVQIPSEVIPPAKPPRLMATPSNITPAKKVEQSRISDNASAVPTFNNSALKNAKSLSHIVSPTVPVLQPPSPRTDVIGNMFIQQHNRPSSLSPTSPPQSPRSVDSSKSTSYLWAGLSPAESNVKLDADSAASASSPSTTNEHGVKVKKSKDRERRRSIIQTITGLFSSSKKEDAKESDSPSKKSSPTKFQLPKFSGKKDKSSKDKLAVDNSYEDGRVRSASSPVTPPNEDGKGGVKPRATSLLASPTSGSEATTPTSGFAVDQCDSSGTPSGQWSTFSSSTKRQSKQARQVARQTELKRLRMAQSIQRQLEEMEVKQKELEEQGVRLERTLRGEEGGVSGRDESALMQEWFQLVHEKNALSRYEQELMVRARELELEDRHARLQQELKDRMSLDDWEDDVFITDGSLEPETVKSPADVDKEGAILTEMLEIVEQKDSLRSMLEEDRQRWAVFLNLIDLAQSSLEDDVFGPDSAEKQEKEDESNGAFQAYSDQIRASEVSGCELWDTGEGQPDTVDSDLEIEEEFEHLFCDDHSNTPPRTDSINDFLESDLVVLEPVENSIREQPQHPAKIAWSSSVEFEGQIVELKDLVSQEELELWSAAATSDIVNDQDVLEFDQLVQDLSEDGTASLGSSLEEKQAPNEMEFESQPIEIIDLNSQGEPEFWSGNDESMPNSDAERAVSSVGTDYEYFYEQRQTAAQIKQKKTSQILREKVEVFDELDRKARKRVEAVEDENDWGSLGVKFTNRGVVRDLVWMWEYNHLQQSGRRGVYPDMNDRPKRKEKKDDRSTCQNDLDSNMHQEEQPQKMRKKRKKIKPNMELERETCQSDPVDGWAWWQIGILFWLTVFSFFILSTLPANSWPSFY
ncbi:F-actin-monooxygenase MICAL3-like isoform X5 [Daphnia carinata]|uniref:F-actin-monooxygenase MICAL3-like isoform X5 n=1 Tax=Daphnia carinata TaxID=120202 RepID=UPI0028695783|nr:F-actin-monooxygenase MICAL3-like isoform X5 [Daphnia carinata]